MLGFTRILDIRKIGLMFLCPLLQVSSQRITWPRRVPPVWLRCSLQPWLLPWTDPSRRIGVYARSGHSVTTWTKPKISGQARNWFLSPLERVSRKTSSLQRFPPGSNRPLSYVINCPTNRPKIYIRFGLMTSAPRSFQGFSRRCAVRSDFGSLSLEVS